MAIVALAFLSRSLVLLAALFWFFVGAPYDTSASLQPPCLSPNRNFEFSNHTTAIVRTVVWDGVYYLRIARCGYEYEQMHAFQPLLPLLMRTLSDTVMRPFIPLLGYSGTLALSGYLINFLSFVLAALYLYKLGILVLKNEKLALRSAVFFCINPASIFYSSIYSESLFALLSFAGMWNFVQGSMWLSAVLFGLSSIARSNGVVHAGFFIYAALHFLFDNALKKRRPLLAVTIALQTLLQVACVVTPFILFQGYGYYQMCANDRNHRPWCKDKLPYLYGFVQRHYWNVGFLRYFQLKQIPNFLSASPALLLASFAIYAYARNQPGLFFSLGLAATPISATSHIRKDTFRAHSTGSEKSGIHKNGVSNGHGSSSDKTVSDFTSFGYCSPAVLPFVFELSFMAAVALFIMHVQVATRFLSSSPVLYWYAAHLSRNSRRNGLILQFVFVSYILLGTLLFVNFYPFT